MKLASTFDNLILDVNHFKQYANLVKQLNKDFLLANIDINYPTSIIPENLKRNLHETIFNLIQDDFAKYLNLLYIIDVSESKIKELDGSDILKLSEKVTLLILQREWQKVWYKYKY